MRTIDLDNNATTRPTPGVVDACAKAMTRLWHNPSSVHRPGQEVRAKVELARRALADLVGAPPRELILTSGGTESNDLAVRGLLDTSPGRVLVTTRIEHASIRDLAKELDRKGEAKVRWVEAGRDGLIDPEALARVLERGAVVTIQWANNETGTIQDVGAIAHACRGAGAVFHCDATQMVGKEPVRVTDANGPDAMTFSPHKFHGPKGVGGLWVRAGVRLRPRIHGSQELERRGGTENVPGIVGAGVAAEEARAWLADAADKKRLCTLRNEFEARLVRECPGAEINGLGATRLWNTTNIGFPGLEAEALLMMLSERGVCASAGAACSSGSLEPSPVLLAMGVPERIAHGSLRFSLSRETTADDVEEAAAIIIESVRRLSDSL